MSSTHMTTENLVIVAIVAIIAFYFAFTQIMSGKPKGIATGIVVGIISYYTIRSIAVELLDYLKYGLVAIALLWFLNHRASVRRARRERERQQQNQQQPRPGARTSHTGGSRR